MVSTDRVLIRPMDPRDLFSIERHLARLPGVHRRRLESQQRGEEIYLIAWLGDLPVGHLLLEWPIGIRQRLPHLSDIAVLPEVQSRGIGTQLMERAEELALWRGFSQTGLHVALDNVRARALYERRGYRDSGRPICMMRYPYLHESGDERWREESCVYLVKDLA